KVDELRIIEAVAAVSKAAPRSLRTQSGDSSAVVFGGELAAQELVAWIIGRAQREARQKVKVAA
ncbi:MAG: hypothetical protein ABI423_11920, partial [Burkholderiales bacterium]